MLVLSESANNLLNNLAQAVGELPPELETAQATFTGVTFGSLLPIGVISGLSAVFSLLLQTILIHFLAKLLGGTGTWRHLIKVLLGFYNKWFPILFFFSYVTIAFMFFSHFSPVIFCFIIVLVILVLYVSGKTSGKIGEAYDFGGAMGCVTLVLSGLVIFAINAVLGYVLGQAFGLALNSTFPPV
jgi:hypothetical protein